MPRKHESRIADQVQRLASQLDGVAAGVVVAVSGGADSVALLRAIDELQVPLVVAHLNHQLRGAESDGDEVFVHDLVNMLNTNRTVPISFRSERVNVAEQATAERGNLEGVARRIRYAWLANVAREANLRYVATGHTADDQAETVLHRIMRGTGLRGLRGIASRRPLNRQVAVIRPLLAVRRVEILQYLQSLDQPFRDDHSNRDSRFTRNRIRHELMPLLAERFNPSIARVLGRLAAEAQTLYARRSQAAAVLLAAAEQPRAGDLVVLQRASLAASPRPCLREVFRLLWEREAWPVGRMDFAAWDRLAGLAFGEALALDLPDGVRARANERVIQLQRLV